MSALSPSPAPRLQAGLAWGVAAALAFSTLGIWGKLASQAGLDSFSTLGLRFGLVALVLLPLSGGVSPRLRRHMLGVGVLYALATTCFFGALDRVSAGTTGLLLYLAPAFVILLGWLAGRRPAGTQLLAVALAAAGLGLVVGLPGPADRDPVGLLLGAGAGVLYATYLMASERWLSGAPPLASTAHMALVAGVYFAGLSALDGTLRLPSSGAQWGPVLGMAVVSTLIAVPALYNAVRHLGAARASLLGTLEPLLTVLLAALVLHEALRPGLLVGGALILCGALLSQRREGRFWLFRRSAAR
ncbi:DMT family transporter [Deinococcus hohokamensis]|uniref:DMT family transporter n=1 Tax=Deinococcus hohokamensis TaxID=309883 RepID=A0ABV9IEN5_9DEIO